MNRISNYCFLNCLQNYTKVIVWGHSIIGDYLYDLIVDAYPDLPVILADNDSNKQVEYKNQKVVSLDKALEKLPDALVVITSFSNEKVMREILINKGVPSERILYGVTKESLMHEIQVLWAQKCKKLDKLQFEVDLAMHCNLDCNCCSQFAPLAETEFVNVEQLKKDFKRLGELFDGTAERIYLIGGEPLLHKEVTECMCIARDNFQDSDINLFTNGLLLKKMNDEFWSICRDKQIGIIVTRYPIGVNYDELKLYVQRKDVSFQFAGTSKDYKYMSNIGIDVEGKQNPEDSFIHCYEANNCIKLRDGRLYTCTRPAAIYKFNKYFNMDLQVSEEDFIDIYSAQDADEILDFLRHPIPFCRYCNQNEHRVSREWTHTTRNIDEWT